VNVLRVLQRLIVLYLISAFLAAIRVKRAVTVFGRCAAHQTLRV
jgi:hypothetical protein